MGNRQSDRMIHVATVGRPHGVRGYVRLTALTEDPATLELFSPLRDAKGQPWYVRWVGRNLASLGPSPERQLDSREVAAQHVNMKLYALRTQFPHVDDDEFYHADLIGMEALEHHEGDVLGIVTSVHDYGGGVSIEITQDERSLIVPFTTACVPTIDMEGGRLEVVLPTEVEVEGDLSLGADVVVRQ